MPGGAGTGDDTRRSYWGSPAMWANVAVSVVVLALFALVVARHLPVWMIGAWAAVPALHAVVVLVMLVAQWRSRRWLRHRPLLGAIVANRSAVVVTEPQRAFDAAVRAVGALPGARLDPSRTSVVAGVVTATTRWNWLTSGERVDVRLFELDREHVVVMVDICAKYRGAHVDAGRVRTLAARFFAALPVDRPYDVWSRSRRPSRARHLRRVPMSAAGLRVSSALVARPGADGGSPVAGATASSRRRRGASSPRRPSSRRRRGSSCR